MKKPALRQLSQLQSRQRKLKDRRWFLQFLRLRFLLCGILMATIFSAGLNLNQAVADEGENMAENKIVLTPLLEQPLFEARRGGRYFVVHLKDSHRVLSTSDVSGGEQTQINHLVNHQSMEANRDDQRMDYILSRTDEQYHQAVAEALAISESQMVLMGTAAHMNHLAHAQAEFRDLRVDAFVTAGVSGNALTAGDPARWYQGDNGNEFVGSNGTINTVLLINQPLTSGAMTKALMVAVEAKSAALMTLAVASKESSHLATGTGTDQIVVAAPQISEAVEADRLLSSASGHLKLGELIGTSVKQATLEALRWQNDLQGVSTRDLVYALQRFGVSRDGLLEKVLQQIPVVEQARLRDNFDSLLREPRVAVAAYAMAAVLDRFQYEGLPAPMLAEAARDVASQLSVAVCGRPQLWSEFWSQLALPYQSTENVFRLAEDLTAQALVLGWSCKWRA